MATIIIFSRSDLKRDPRVYRQIETLSKYHDIIPIGFNPPLDKFPKSIELRRFGFPHIQGKTKIEKLKNLFTANSIPIALRVLLKYLSSPMLIFRKSPK